MILILQQYSGLPMDTWENCYFFLPFRLSPRISDNQYGGELADRVLTQQTVPQGARTLLYLRFKSATTYVIRASIFFTQKSSLSLDSNGRSWKNWDNDQ